MFSFHHQQHHYQQYRHFIIIITIITIQQYQYHYHNTNNNNRTNKRGTNHMTYYIILHTYILHIITCRFHAFRRHILYMLLSFFAAAAGLQCR